MACAPVAAERASRSRSSTECASPPADSRRATDVDGRHDRRAARARLDRTRRVRTRGQAGPRRTGSARSRHTTYFARRGRHRTGSGGPCDRERLARRDSSVGRAWYAARHRCRASSDEFTLRSGNAHRSRRRRCDPRRPARHRAADRCRLVLAQRRSTCRVPFFLRAGSTRARTQFDLIARRARPASDTRYLFNSTLQAAGVDGPCTRRRRDRDVAWSWKRHAGCARSSRGITHGRRESAHDRSGRRHAAAASRLRPDPSRRGSACSSAACNDSDSNDRVSDWSRTVPFRAAGSRAAARGRSRCHRRSSVADRRHRASRRHITSFAPARPARTRASSPRRDSPAATQIRSLFPGHTSERRFVDPDAVCGTDVGRAVPDGRRLACCAIARATRPRTSRTRGRPSRRSQFDGGLRWELMWVGTAAALLERAVTARSASSWDPLGNGRSRDLDEHGPQLRDATGRVSARRSCARSHRRSRRCRRSGEGRSSIPARSYARRRSTSSRSRKTRSRPAQKLRSRRPSTRRCRRKVAGSSTHSTRRCTASTTPAAMAARRALARRLLVGGELATAPTGKLVLRAGYMYGRTIGSWTGAFDPRKAPCSTPAPITTRARRVSSAVCRPTSAIGLI